MAKKTADDAPKSFMDWFKSPQTEEKSVEEGSKTNAALLKQIEDMGKRLDDQDRRLSEARTSVAQPAFASNDAPEAPQLDLTGLPDPFLEPDKYTKEYTKRNQDFVKATMAFERGQENAQAAQTAQFTAQADGLWAWFKEKYPDYASKEKLVRFAAGEVAQRAANEGKDVMAYMFNSRQAFADDVVKEIADVAGSPKAAAAEPETDRTGGLFGASTPASKPGAEAPGDMIKDLRDMQKNLGLY